MEAEERERAQREALQRTREAIQREMDAINQRIFHGTGAFHGSQNGGLRPPR